MKEFSRSLLVFFPFLFLMLCLLATACDTDQGASTDTVEIEDSDMLPDLPVDMNTDITENDAANDQEPPPACDDTAQKEIDGVCTAVPNLSIGARRLESTDGTVRSSLFACTRSVDFVSGPGVVVETIEEAESDNCQVKLVDTTVMVEPPPDRPEDEPLPVGTITFSGTGLLDVFELADDDRAHRCQSVAREEEDLFRPGTIQVNVSGSSVFPPMSFTMNAPEPVDLQPQEVFEAGQPYTITWTNKDDAFGMNFLLFGTNSEKTRKATVFCEGDSASGELTIPGEITALVPDDGSFDIVGSRSALVREEPAGRDVVVFYSSTSQVDHIVQPSPP